MRFISVVHDTSLIAIRLKNLIIVVVDLSVSLFFFFLVFCVIVSAGKDIRFFGFHYDAVFFRSNLNASIVPRFVCETIVLTTCRRVKRHIITLYRMC